MPNQIVNPLVHHHSAETLINAADALAYLSESVTKLELSETSFAAQQGLSTLINCVTQAVNYEARRLLDEEEAHSSEPKSNLGSFLAPLEKELIIELFEQLKTND